ncbi:hypothetical protein PTKIN_Ptkin15bG0003700 [Pterospermum kingtungense]
MCKRSKSESTPTSTEEITPNTKDMNHLTLAPNNDVEGIKLCIEKDASSIDEVGLWNSREKGSNQIVAKHRTPLMVVATYGSIDAVKLLLTHSAAVNISCGTAKSTALQCAASGGSLHAIAVVNLLLSASPDPNCTDSIGCRPADVVIAHPKLQSMRAVLEQLLSGHVCDDPFGEHNLRISIDNSTSSSPTLSSSLENGSPPSPLNLASSPMASNFIDVRVDIATEKKEYPVEPSLPDIKNSIYATDEFCMFSFKIRPCSIAYSRDWTECPFVYPRLSYARMVIVAIGESAFLSTKPRNSARCISSGSAVLSPRASSSTNVMDIAATMSLLLGSPSSAFAMSPSPFDQQPMSPSANALSHSYAAWPQPNVPTFCLPGSNLQSSRLRSSLSARDIPYEDFSMLPDFDGQSRNISASVSRTSLSRTLTPSNLEELFSAEISSSPRYIDHVAASAVFSPTHKSTVFNLLQQQHSMLSSINTSVFSPKRVDHPLLQASLGVGSPGRMSPRSVEPISPMGARLEKQQQQLRSLSSRELGTNNPAPIVGSLVNASWSTWGSPNGNLEQSVIGDKNDPLQRSSSSCKEPDLSWIQSLVKESPPKMMKEKSAGSLPASASSSEVLNKSNSNINSIDHSVIEAWLENMQLDQLVV